MSYYISITGLELKSMFHSPKFWFYAIPAMTQAKQAPGNISADGSYIQGTHHTLTVWKDRRSMLNYMRSGSHAKAMKIFDDIATGKTYGYESDIIPTWEEVRNLYETKARVVGKAARDQKALEKNKKLETTEESTSGETEEATAHQTQAL